MGLVESFSEFLPISSTAHLILTGDILRIPNTEFLKTYNISIQLGAILAVVFLYWKKILNSKDLILKILAAFVPTSVIGLLLYKVFKNYLMESLSLIAITLFLGGVFLILFEKRYRNKVKENQSSEISYKKAVIIGLVQSLAIVPGVSRSAATIISGLGIGLKRETIVEFSFLLAIPTMAGATFLDILKNQETIMGLSNQDLITWAIGFILSFITAIIGVKFLLKFIKTNNFIPFGWYRIGLGIAITLFLLLK